MFFLYLFLSFFSLVYVLLFVAVVVVVVVVAVVVVVVVMFLPTWDFFGFFPGCIQEADILPKVTLGL